MRSRVGQGRWHLGGLKSCVAFFGGFCVYLDLFDTALQKDKSFPEASALEIFPKRLHILEFWNRAGVMKTLPSGLEPV